MGPCRAVVLACWAIGSILAVPSQGSPSTWLERPSGEGSSRVPQRHAALCPQYPLEGFVVSFILKRVPSEAFTIFSLLPPSAEGLVRRSLPKALQGLGYQLPAWPYGCLREASIGGFTEVPASMSLHGRESEMVSEPAGTRFHPQHLVKAEHCF